MSRIAVVGGHGQIAQLLHPLLVQAGHTPVALVRKEEQRARLEGLGAEVRLLDIEADEAPAFAEAFAGCDTVVFAAGGGPDGNIDRKRTVDLGGSLKSIEAAGLAGISRFVQVSAISVDDPLPAGTSPVWTAYVEAKRDADAALRRSGLDWTILRPGTADRRPADGQGRRSDPRSRRARSPVPTSPPSWPPSSTRSPRSAPSGTWSPATRPSSRLSLALAEPGGGSSGSLGWPKALPNSRTQNKLLVAPVDLSGGLLRAQ